MTNDVKIGRESNIELLRILAMIGIIAGHFVSQGGINVTNGGLASILVSSAGRMAVDVFLLIGCWFMVDAKFRPERMVKLYAEVCFYSIPITLAMVAIGEAGGFRNVVQGCVPFFGRSVWFASAYISLIALTPCLNRAFELPRTALARLVLLLFVLFSVVSTVPQFTPFEYLADFAWFPVVYLFVGWAKKGEVLDRLGTPIFNVLVAVGIYAGLCALELTPLHPIASFWLNGIRSLPALVFAVFLFNAFRRFDLGRRRTVNLLARSSFAVYVVHQIPAFEHFEWSLFRPELISSWPGLSQAAGLMAVSFVVFLSITLIDAVRIRFLEPLYMRSRLVLFLTECLSSFYDGDCHPQKQS